MKNVVERMRDIILGERGPEQWDLCLQMMRVGCMMWDPVAGAAIYELRRGEITDPTLSAVADIAAPWVLRGDLADPVRVWEGGAKNLPVMHEMGGIGFLAEMAMMVEGLHDVNDLINVLGRPLNASLH